jgi:Fe-S-cluster containining protein
MTNPHVCARCSAIQPSCCIIKSEEEGICFPLFPEEVERISAAAGHERWMAHEPNSPKFIEVMKKMLPLDRERIPELFPAGGVHPSLGVGEDGTCFFLGPEGCVLGRETRPYHCRLFPLWMKGSRIMVLEADCLARREARNLDGLLASVNLTRDAVRDLFSRLRRAWGL